MKCKILMPYIDYNNMNFDADDNYYSKDGYANALRTNDTMYGETIYTHINQNGGVLSHLNTYNVGFNVLNQKVSENEEKTAYSSCECQIYDENMSDATVLHLQNCIKSQDVCILYLKLDFDTMEEDFESDLKMWMRSHDKINSYKANDEWKFDNEPKRNLRINVEDLNIDLINCKILEINNDKIAILAEKIKYVI